MPTTTPRSIALTFAPDYVTFALEVWRRQRLRSEALEAFEASIGTHADQYFTERAAMGCRTEQVASRKITQAVNLLKSLGLVKQTGSGPQGVREKWLWSTPSGDLVLNEQPAAGGLYPLLAGAIVANSPQLHTLLDALHSSGPLTQPVLNPVSGAPTRGAVYAQLVIDGIATYELHYEGTHSDDTPISSSASGGKKPGAAQLLKSAAARASRRHPAGELSPLEMIVSVGLGLGLLWEELKQVNEVIAARRIGSASSLRDGTYSPAVPDWNMDRASLVDALAAASAECADATGYATVEAVRGALGSRLRLSPIAADYLLVKARDAGDRGDIRLALHFEPNEDLLYSPRRHPLIWRGHAYDFIEVRAVTGGPRPRVATVPITRR